MLIRRFLFGSVYMLPKTASSAFVRFVLPSPATFPYNVLYPVCNAPIAIFFLSSVSYILFFIPVHGSVKIRFFIIGPQFFFHIKVCVNRLHRQKTGEPPHAAPADHHINSRNIRRMQKTRAFYVGQIPFPTIIYKKIQPGYHLRLSQFDLYTSLILPENILNRYSRSRADPPPLWQDHAPPAHTPAERPAPVLSDACNCQR